MQQPQPFSHQSRGDVAEPCDITSWPIETRDKAKTNGVTAHLENDRNCRRCLFSHLSGKRAAGDSNHRYMTAHQVGFKGRQSAFIILRPTIFDHDILALDKTGLLQTLPERVEVVLPTIISRLDFQEPNPRHRRLLPPRRNRPSRSASKQRNHVAAIHSMTSSASASSEGKT